ncbi:MAG: glucosyltransferase domain-containing protein [Butyrivibrio sp.]|nr:glucosyltransferase domain-containing protein [Butyrivibrio sp.]
MKEDRKRIPLLLLVADVICVIMAYGMLYRQQFGSDTLFRMLYPEGDIGGALDHARYGSYLLAELLLHLGIQITDYYKLFYGIFVLAIIADIFMIQRMFLPFFEKRLEASGQAGWLGYLVCTALPFANVLFIENFMFPEYHINYAIAYTLAVAGAWLLGRRRWLPGLLCTVVACVFYQTVLIPMAMLVTAYMVLEADFTLSGALVRRVMLTDVVILLIGLADNQSSRLIPSLNGVSKKISMDLPETMRYLAHELRSLCQSSLGLMPGIWVPGLVFLLSALLLGWGVLRTWKREKRENSMIWTAVLLILAETLLFLLLPVLSGYGGFYPRVVWPFYMYVALLMLTGAYHIWDDGNAGSMKLLPGIMVGGFLVLQVFCCQMISENRYISNTLDLVYARAVNREITDYEARTGNRVTKVAIEIDGECPRYYEGMVRYCRDQINERTIAVTPYCLLEYVNGADIRLTHVDMDKKIWKAHFADGNWDEFNPGEQLYFEGDTLYWVVF